jgi:competence protein ComEA
VPFDLTRSEAAAYVACCLLVVMLGWRVLRSDGEAGASAAAPAGAGARTAAATSPAGADDGGGADGVSVTAAPARDGSATVHVVGAVRHAGVYRLRLGRRVQDAIARAGGATARADLQAINLAAKVADGQQIVVPGKGAAGRGGASAAGGAAVPAGGSAGAAAAPVNLNAATVEQLDTLDGVGPATAQKILEYRSQHGGFSSVDELGQISGIGPKRLESLRAQVTV